MVEIDHSFTRAGVLQWRVKMKVTQCEEIFGFYYSFVSLAQTFCVSGYDHALPMMTSPLLTSDGTPSSTFFQRARFHGTWLNLSDRMRTNFRCQPQKSRAGGCQQHSQPRNVLQVRPIWDLTLEEIIRRSSADHWFAYSRTRVKL